MLGGDKRRKDRSIDEKRIKISCMIKHLLMLLYESDSDGHHKGKEILAIDANWVN